MASVRSGFRYIVANTESVRMPPVFVTVTVTGKGIGTYRTLPLSATIVGASIEHSRIGSVGGMYVLMQHVTSSWLSNEAVMQNSVESPFVRRLAATCQTTSENSPAFRFFGVPFCTSESGETSWMSLAL